MKVVEFKREPYPTAMLVVGFPSHGLVGAVATNFLIQELSMDLVATLHGDTLPPTVSVVDGVGVSPLQIWAGTERCGLDGECEQLLVVKSDIPPPVEMYLPLADGVLRWAKEKGIRLVVVLEGVAVSGDGASELADVAGVVGPHSRDLLGRKEFQVLARGGHIISGAGGAFLAKSAELQVPVLALFTGANAEFPDSAAAAKLLAALNPLIPHVDIDPEPLRQRAAVIEKALRKHLVAQKESMSRLADSSGGMYA